MNQHATTDLIDELPDRLGEAVRAAIATLVSVMVLLCGAWLLHQRGDAPAADGQPGVAAQRTVRMEDRAGRSSTRRAGGLASPEAPAQRERGGLAETYGGGDAGAPNETRLVLSPITVYLVNSPDQAHLVNSRTDALGAPPEQAGEQIILAAGTPYQEAQARAAIEHLETAQAVAAVARPVIVVDLRQR